MYRVAQSLAGWKTNEQTNIQIKENKKNKQTNKKAYAFFTSSFSCVPKLDLKVV